MVVKQRLINGKQNSVVLKLLYQKNLLILYSGNGYLNGYHQAYDHPIVPYHPVGYPDVGYHEGSQSGVDHQSDVHIREVHEQRRGYSQSSFDHGKLQVSYPNNSPELRNFLRGLGSMVYNYARGRGGPGFGLARAKRQTQIRQGPRQTGLQRETDLQRQIYGLRQGGPFQREGQRATYDIRQADSQRQTGFGIRAKRQTYDVRQRQAAGQTGLREARRQIYDPRRDQTGLREDQRQIYDPRHCQNGLFQRENEGQRLFDEQADVGLKDRMMQRELNSLGRIN